MHGIMALRSGNSASKAVALFKKIWIIKYLFRWNRFVLLFCCDIFCGSRNSSAEAERVEQEMSYTNSNRTSDDLVWKIVESIRWDWNVSSVVLIRDPSREPLIKQISNICFDDTLKQWKSYLNLWINLTIFHLYLQLLSW